MHTSITSSVFRFAGRVGVVLLIVFLLWFEIVPGEVVRNAQYNVDAGFQRERSRMFVNSAYALLYRPASERIQAMRDLQITLPAFQQEQAFLWSNSDSDVRSLLQQAQPDYLTLVATVQTLIEHPDDPISPAEAESIVSHDQKFFLPMNMLVTVLQQQIQQQDAQLIMMRVVVEGLCLTTSLLLIILERNRSMHLEINGRISSEYEMRDR